MRWLKGLYLVLGLGLLALVLHDVDLAQVAARVSQIGWGILVVLGLYLVMFVFDSLLSVDNRGIQALLREVSNDVLVVALKGAVPEMQDHILSNMSKRAATLLKEDIEARGPTRLSEVEQAQKEILEVARRLADSGDLDLGQGGDEYV